MSTPPAPAKPDAPGADSAAERRSNDALVPREGATSSQADVRTPMAPAGRDRERRDPTPQLLGAVRSDRTVDADLLIDIPQLSVEDLTLELDASLLLNHIKLEAKGLEAGLYAKADFDSLAALAERGSGGPLGRMSEPQRRSDMRARTALRELLGATRDAYRDLSDRDVQQQLRDVHASARDAYRHVATDAEPQTADGGEGGGTEHAYNGAGSHSGREHARHIVAQGVKAAGLTAAGLAGGALLQAHTKPSRKLPIPRRPKGMRAVREAIAKRLP